MLEREKEGRGGAERGRAESQAGSVPSVRSPTWGLNSQILRSWPELKSSQILSLLSHPGTPSIFFKKMNYRCFKIGSQNLSTINILSRTIHYFEGLIHCRIFGSIPSFYPLDLPVIAPHFCDNQKWLRHCQMSPKVQNDSRLRTAALNKKWK